MPFNDEHWEDVYLKTPPGDLPWNSGGPDPDLVRWVRSGEIPVGQALDMGTGPGHDAVYLIQQGFNVIGIDISPAAIALARETASAAGVFGFFQIGDIRQIPVEDQFIDFAYDRGCFHVLSPEDRPQAIAEVKRVLRAGGLYGLRVFSDQEPGTEGPFRFSRQELEELFRPGFHILKLREGVFEGPRKPKSYSLLMRKK